MTDAFDRLKAALSNRYAIERELGSGGMATVYLAHDQKHDRKVAIKVMRPELSAILGGERFLREVTIAAKLNHPHILAVSDFGENPGGLLYIVSELLRGSPLDLILERSGPLPLARVMRVVLTRLPLHRHHRHHQRRLLLPRHQK